MTIEIHRFDDSQQAAQALAGAVAADLRQVLLRQPRALLLLSGGRSPVAVFAALAAEPLAWDRIDVSLVDERSVAPGAPAANAALVEASLLVDAARAARLIALMPTAVFQAAADPWDAALQAAARANADPSLARPDVVVLGMGNDGHTASLFNDAPQWPEASTTGSRYVALQPQAAPHARVSLSLQALQQQKQCYLWAVGADKSATLAGLAQAVKIAQLTTAGVAALAHAGPAVACLIADPTLLLQAYCSDAA
ncbi:MAG: 6-phosphogluconolactonase [Herminiimonas sp.]|nr:6-phosphogluconolactonase [Herminiimonas sp.]